VTVLKFKGVKPTRAALDNLAAEDGDVWIIESDNSEYVWVPAIPAEGEEGQEGYKPAVDAHWEQLGATIDLSSYVTKAELQQGYYTKSETDLNFVKEVDSMTAEDINALFVEPEPEPEPGAKVINQTGVLTQLFINADASDEELAEVVRKGLETWGSSSKNMYILFSTMSDITQQPGEGDVLVLAGCDGSSGGDGGAVDIYISFIDYGTQELHQYHYAIAYNYGSRTGVYDSNTSSPTAGQKMSGIIALPAVAGSYQGVVVTSAPEMPPMTWSEHPEVIVPVVSFNENPWE